MKCLWCKGQLHEIDRTQVQIRYECLKCKRKQMMLNEEQRKRSTQGGMSKWHI